MKTIVERLEERDIAAWSDPYSSRARGAEAAARIRELEAALRVMGVNPDTLAGEGE